MKYFKKTLQTADQNWDQTNGNWKTTNIELRNLAEQMDRFQIAVHKFQHKFGNFNLTWNQTNEHLASMVGVMDKLAENWHETNQIMNKSIDIFDKLVELLEKR
jgi:type II secretory pathway component PulF